MVCDLTTGLVALYKYTGNTLDSSGNGNTLTNNGASLTTDKNAVSNQAYDFALNDFMSRASAVITSYPCSINAFVAQSGASQANAGIAGIGLSTTNNMYVFLGVNSNLPIAVSRNGLFNAATATTNIGTSGTWYMITGIFHSATSREIFVNAVSEGTNSVSTAFPSVDQTVIGIAPDDFADQKFIGKIDEIRFYNIAISQDTMDALLAGYDTPSCILPATNKSIFFSQDL